MLPLIDRNTWSTPGDVSASSCHSGDVDRWRPNSSAEKILRFSAVARQIRSAWVLMPESDARHRASFCASRLPRPQYPRMLKASASIMSLAAVGVRGMRRDVSRHSVEARTETAAELGPLRGLLRLRGRTGCSRACALVGIRLTHVRLQKCDWTFRRGTDKLPPCRVCSARNLLPMRNIDSRPSFRSD
jgi:hypothetical protein